MSDNQKNIEAQMDSYRRDHVEAEVKKMFIDTEILNPEQIKRYLQNGLELKASGREKIPVTVIQVNQGSVDNRIHQEIYNLTATLNPKIDIDEGGYVTHAWFDMSWILDSKKRPSGGIKAFMQAADFRPYYPIKCFRCYIDENEIRLLPLPMS